MKLKEFDILREDTAVAKMHVTSFCSFLQLEKLLSRDKFFSLDCTLLCIRQKGVYLFNC